MAASNSTRSPGGDGVVSIKLIAEKREERTVFWQTDAKEENRERKGEAKYTLFFSPKLTSQIIQIHFSSYREGMERGQRWYIRRDPNTKKHMVRRKEALLQQKSISWLNERY